MNVAHHLGTAKIGMNKGYEEKTNVFGLMTVIPTENFIMRMRMYQRPIKAVILDVDVTEMDELYAQCLCVIQFRFHLVSFVKSHF